MKTRFTWKWVAKAVATGPLDADIAAEALAGLKMLASAVLALVLRTSMLLLFPVSVPALVYGFRWEERRRASNSLARRKAQDDDV